MPMIFPSRVSPVVPKPDEAGLARLRALLDCMAYARAPSQHEALLARVMSEVEDIRKFRRGRAPL